MQGLDRRSRISHSHVVFISSDMQKFPLRMKDNDLLVTELYHDPSNDAITALSVYLTPKTSQYTSLKKKQKMFIPACVFPFRIV